LFDKLACQLEETVRNQARYVAKRRMSRSDQMMRLEKRELSKDEREKVLERMMADITNTMPKLLWDEK